MMQSMMIESAAKIETAESHPMSMREAMQSMMTESAAKIAIAESHPMSSPRVSENLEEALDFSEFVVSQLEDLQDRLADKKAQSSKLAEALETEKRARAQLEQTLQVRKRRTFGKHSKQDSPHVSENLEESLDDYEFVLEQLQDLQNRLAAKNAQSDKLAEALETEKCPRAQLEKKLQKKKKTTWKLPEQDSLQDSEKQAADEIACSLSAKQHPRGTRTIMRYAHSCKVMWLSL
jgi:DNA repair exonuclease SbcCD ATPase subunit